ncbi:MAG: hypothetical protein ACLQDV_30285 [Candidatus Binataceae bacterium]
MPRRGHTEEQIMRVLRQVEGGEEVAASFQAIFNPVPYLPVRSKVISE